MSTVSPPAPRRIEIFDGLRGLAIILVVLSHGWTLWPNEYVSTHRPLSTLFGSGNFAVSIFFVVGAFVATQGMLRKAQSPEGLHPVVDVARRYVRLTGQVGFMLLVLLLVLVFDDTDVNSKEVTQTSVLRVLSYSWNWYLQDNALNARPDIGHLWYLSVYLQAMVLVVFIVWLLRRRPVWLPVTLGALLLATELWTAHVYESEGVIHALLRTSVRIDAPLTGALAASLLSLLHPRLGRYRAHLGRWCVLAAVALLPLAYLTTPNAGYFSWPGLLTDAALFVFVTSAALGPVPRLLSATLGVRPLVFLGSRSLGLYIWHYPVFYFVSRHVLDWHWGWRTVLALSLTLVCVLVSEWLVESRVQRALQAPGWRELDYGLPAYLRRRIRSARVSSRETRSSEIPSRRFTRS